MNQINICIIDDHKIVRQGLIELLHKLGHIKVTHEFENGEEFLEALPLDHQPDIFILDYSMPNLTGIDVLKQLENKEEIYKVLLLTQHFDENIINEAYHFGARGFLNKNCTAHDLKFAINNIVTIGYNNVSEILKRVKNYEDNNQAAKKTEIDITKREYEFLTMVCDENEYTYDQMAQKMGLSVKSLENYRVSLFEKFDIKSKVGLVLFSFKNRLTPPFL